MRIWTGICRRVAAMLLAGVCLCAFQADALGGDVQMSVHKTQLGTLNAPIAVVGGGRHADRAVATALSADNSTLFVTFTTLIAPKTAADVARSGFSVMRNGSIIGSYDAVTPVAVANDGAAYAFLTQIGEDYFLCTQAGQSKIARTGSPDWKRSPSVSPDGKIVSFVLNNDRDSYFVVDSKVFGPFQDFRAEGLVFSPDSRRYGFLAARQKNGASNKWVSVIDGTEGPNSYDAMGCFSFSPDSQRAAWVAGNKGNGGVEAHVIVTNANGHVVVGPNIYGLSEAGVIWSADSQHVGYVGLARDGKQFAVIDGVSQDRFAGIQSLGPLFSPDGNRIGYLAFTGSNWLVIVDRNDIGVQSLDGVGERAFSPDSKRFAYAAYRHDEWTIICDGQESREYDNIAHSGLCFTPDSRFVVFEARRNSAHFLVVGNTEIELPGPSIGNSKIRFDSSNECSLVVSDKDNNICRLVVTIE